MDEMNGEFASLSELDGILENVDTEKFPSDSMNMNGEESNVVLGVEDKIEHLKEPVIVFKDEENKEHALGEASNEENTKEEMRNKEDAKHEAKDAEILGVDSRKKVNMSENIDTEKVPSDSMNMNGEKSNVVLGVEDKIEHLKEPIIVLKDEENKEHEIGEASNEENTKEEMKSKEDAKDEAKDVEILEVDARKKVSKLSKKSKKLKKKKLVLRQKAKGCVISNVDTEVVPPYLLKMKCKESSISASVSDKDEINDVVGTEKATAEKNDTIDKLDVRLATSKPGKGNGEESDVEDKDENLNKSIMVSGDNKKKECGISEASNHESTKEEMKNEEKTRNDAKNEEQLEANFKKKVSRSRKRGKKKTAALRGTSEVAAKYTDNPESSNKNSRMMAKGTGMIFMCSSKTKKDCYHYKVLGLPAKKRDTVLKICEGMNLFLFDYNLRLMYGIYKAAGPGGYNIEPKAFNSAFPSQVRFTVEEEYAPLSEKKFKTIIKDNYYCNKKFHCELTSKQVKDLCKLFRASIKSSESKLLLRTPRAETSTYGDRESTRQRRRKKAETHTFMDSKPKGLLRTPRAGASTYVDRESTRQRRSKKAETHTFMDSKPKGLFRTPRAEASTYVDRESTRPRRSRKAETHTFMDSEPKRLRQSPRSETHTFLYQGSARYRHWEEERHPAPPRDYLYPEEPVIYRREVCASPEAYPPPRRPLPWLSTAAHSPSLDSDIYRRDPRRYRDPQLVAGELRHRHEFEEHDPYLTSRDRPTYHDPLFSSTRQPEYHHGRTSQMYHLSPGLRPEYRPPPPLTPGLRPEYRPPPPLSQYYS